MHDIHKRVQPPTFSGGVNLKLEATLSFLRMVENLFEGELSEKVKVRAIFFFVERTRWTRVKVDREETNKGPMETWSKFKK